MDHSMRLASPDGSTWTGSGHLTVRGVLYSVTFERGGCRGPVLKLTPTVASASVFRGTLSRCGCGFAEFSFGHGQVCTGETADPTPCNNLLKIRVELPPSGWYCVRDSGGDGPCYAVELLSADLCDDSIEVCGGPYATQEEADTACTSEAPS